MKTITKEKCEALLAGNEVIMSDEELDELIPFNIGVYVASRFNPNQVGTKDRYIVFIKNLAKANVKPWGT